MHLTDLVKIAIELACKNLLLNVRIEKKRKLYQILKCDVHAVYHLVGWQLITNW
jgi:hypothetical protein